MRKFITLMVVGTLLCASYLHAQTRRFAKYVGHEPRELFAGEPDVTNRLGVILGRNYKTFMTNIDVQGPLAIYHGYIYGFGCRPHFCDSEEAALLINLRTGSIHCALHTARDPDHFVTYTEDADHFPTEELNYVIRENSADHD